MHTRAEIVSEVVSVMQSYIAGEAKSLLADYCARMKIDLGRAHSEHVAIVRTRQASHTVEWNAALWVAGKKHVQLLL